VVAKWRDAGFNYPSATQWSKTGAGWGLVQALNFALSRHKRFAIGETGVGGNNVRTGPADDPLFPAYLRARLEGFRAKGGVVDHTIVWDYNAGDGAWVSVVWRTQVRRPGRVGAVRVASSKA